eukprot:TRINITY_DN9766_c0_g1_i2.p1 TRINITY_DN9766_c0_g1~~TRINITY_DN9766_c0_g1_i2.p1  ORF type:complete len:381 (-),score=76.61 TRINITY_DN9766_c0_g1_i2:115-1257(-)
MAVIDNDGEAMNKDLETERRRVGTYLEHRRGEESLSVDGYTMKLLKSCMQKEIRNKHGNLDKAFYQLLTIARAIGASNERKSLEAAGHYWIQYRLFVIVAEDVGAAAPGSLWWVRQCVNHLKRDHEDIRAVIALKSLLNGVDRNRDLDYIRHCFFSHPKVLEAQNNSSNSSSTEASVPVEQLIRDLAEALRDSEDVKLKAFKILLNILFTGVTYNAQKEGWGSRIRKLSNGLKDQIWEVIRESHSRKDFVDVCKEGFEMVYHSNKLHGDGWWFFALCCFVRTLPDHINEASETERFNKAYEAVTLQDLENATTAYQPPEEAYDMHAATDKMTIPPNAMRTFMENLARYYKPHERSLLHENFSKAYLTMDRFEEPANYFVA